MYCAAGRKHIWLRNENVVQLCCSCTNQDDHKYSLEGTNFYDLITSKKFYKNYKQLLKRPLPDCTICKQTEREKKQSIRKKINRITDDGMGKYFLKLDLSNKCNLKCVMCSSSRSTNWIKDEQKLIPMYKQHGYPIDPPFGHTTLGVGWWNDAPLEFWQDMGMIEISGGEPFYQEEVLEFLQFLITVNTKLRLQIITNATVLNKQILDLIKNFSKLHILCSVDAWEEKVYNYSRYGSGELGKVKENILELIKISYSCNIVDTLHPFNYNQPALRKIWLEENNLKIMCTNSLVYTPSHLDNRKVLPEEFWPDGNKNVELQLKFARWTLALDKIRKTNIFDIRPEFESWFKGMNVC